MRPAHLMGPRMSVKIRVSLIKVKTASQYK